MKRIAGCVAGISAALMLAGCTTPGSSGQGQRYVPASAGAGPLLQRQESTGGGQDPTALERVAAAEEKFAAEKVRSDELSQRVASLTLSMEEMRRDNDALLRSADALREERDITDGMLVDLQERLRVLTDERIALLDQVLAEKIQRVRTERELILAKIEESDGGEDG